MINNSIRKKLIDGLAGAAGVAKGSASEYEDAKDEPDGDEPSVPMDGDSAEGLNYAHDALAAISEYRGMYMGSDSEDPSVKAIRDKQRDIVAAAFREAIWGLMRSYKDA